MSPPLPRARFLLALAAIAVAFAAADTYVVVLALPDMMASVGLSAEQLQRAAPVVSGFLLGYVAMLPLIGRIADLRGRVPVLVGSLVVFAVGSLVTAASYDLASLVVGRFVQGVGGGGLVPATLALVADLYPPPRRGLPLGVVGAVQELGSVLGPLYGALVLAVGGWRDIFWINLGVGLLLAAAVAGAGRQRPRGARPRSGVRRRWDPVAAVLGVLLLVIVLLVMRQPASLVTSVQWGGPFVPFSDGASVWWSPLGVAGTALAIVLVGWLLWSPWSPWDRTWWRTTLGEADLSGAALLALTLAGIILAFATADPEVQVLSAGGRWWLVLSVVSACLAVLHHRRVALPLVPRGALATRTARGALATSFFVGAALIVALVDIPVFARATLYGDSQLRAALVLVELLVAVPIGAVLGGYALRRVPASWLAAAGMGLTAAGFAAMAGWQHDALAGAASSVVLVVAGLGFGLSLAPVNAALLGATAPAVHGVVSALLVVSRMVGMLIGISALTTIGLRRYYAVAAGFPSPSAVCGAGSTRCDRYTALLEHAGIAQLHAIFLGAVGCALAAGVIALATLRAPATEDARLLDAVR
ncbi:MAG: MFS transporter [Marmoricola sp.]